MTVTPSEKKKEYNRKYRENKRKEKEAQKANTKTEKVEIKVQKVEEKETEEEKSDDEYVEVKHQESENDNATETIETMEEETVILDKATYNFLISQARMNAQQSMQETTPRVVEEQKPRDEKTDTGFFFHVKRQCISTMASLVPMIGIQAVILGMKFLRNTASNSTQPNTQRQLNTSQQVQHEAYTGRLESLA